MPGRESDVSDAPVDSASKSDAETVRPEFRPPSPRFRRRRRGARSGDLFLLFVVFLVAVLLVAYDFDRIFSLLYQPVAGIVLVVMVVEYLVLKSMDRTRVYEIENLRLREQRRSDREMMLRARTLLEEKLAQEKGTPSDEEAAQWRARASDLAAELPRRTPPA